MGLGVQAGPRVYVGDLGRTGGSRHGVRGPGGAQGPGGGSGTQVGLEGPGRVRDGWAGAGLGGEKQCRILFAWNRVSLLHQLCSSPPRPRPQMWF